MSLHMRLMATDADLYRGIQLSAGHFRAGVKSFRSRTQLLYIVCVPATRPVHLAILYG